MSFRALVWQLGAFCVWALVCLSAFSQSPATDVFDLGPAVSPLQLGIDKNIGPRVFALQGLPAESTPQEAIFSPEYKPFDAAKVYTLAENKALWLRFKIKNDPASLQRWTVRFDKTFLDRIYFYTQNAQGQWQQRQAGDHIAHAQWSKQALFPQFDLQHQGANEHEILIKLVQNFSMQIPITLLSSDQAALDNQNDFLLSGILIGALAVIFLLALHLALNYKDRVYAWYSLYVLLSMLACTAYLGSASYVWWPHSHTWPEYTTLSFSLAAVASQVWFCQAMFLRQVQASWLKIWSRRTALVSMALIVLFLTPFVFTLSANYRIVIFAIGMLLCLVSIATMVTRGVREKQAAAYYWLVAYTPLGISVVIVFLDNLASIQLVELPYSAPAFTLAFEAVVLLFALHLHAKDRHALIERERTMDEIDPLTGCLSSGVFNTRLYGMWSQSIQEKQDISLAYVYVHHSSKSNDAQSTLRLEAKLLRSVRHIRTIMRDVDLIGRVGGNVIAVAMPQIPLGEGLTNRLSRLVAMGLMVDNYEKEPIELYFRIAVGTRDTCGDDLRSLQSGLRKQIEQTSGGSRKPIQYVNATSMQFALQSSTPSQAPASSGVNSVTTS
jgi:two-component system, sensor histidine kinase LadS